MTTSKPQRPLQLMAISDLHLGQDTSLLSFPQGRWHLWNEVRRKLGATKGELVIDQLVLVGDIPDRCLSSTAQIITDTNAFPEIMQTHCHVHKLVYIPGNHDHSLWTGYRGPRLASEDNWITGPDGEILISKVIPQKIKIYNRADEIAMIYFGYPYGAPWQYLCNHNNKGHPFEFRIANPIYATKLNNSKGPERLYVFSHGAHLDWFVIHAADTARKARTFLKWALGAAFGNFPSGVSIRDIQSLECARGSMMDYLWRNTRNNSTPLIGELYSRWCQAVKWVVPKRGAPPCSACFSWADLKTKATSGRINRLTTKNHEPHSPFTKRLMSDFWPFARRFLNRPGFLDHEDIPVTFVYGHTHSGGWGEPVDRDSIVSNFRLYDLGGWVVEAPRRHHPACHILVVDHEGEEFLIDVSFKGVKITDEDLLDVAGNDYKNRHTIWDRIKFR